MSVLQTNLDKGTVLVPGEYLDIISAVYADAKGGTYGSHGQSAGHCAFDLCQYTAAAYTQAGSHILDMSPSDLSLAGSA